LDQSIFTQMAIAGLVFSMLGMGMTLRPTDFGRVIATPKAVAAGLTAQMIGLPLVAFAMVALLELNATAAIALIALAACPGGASSNSLSYFAKGDVPLSITLTALNSLLSFVSTPLVIGAGLALLQTREVEIQLSFWSSAAQILLTVVLPVLAGMALAWRRPATAARAAKPLIYLGLTLIVVPTLLLPLRGTGISAATFGYYAALTGALNVLGMLIAFTTGRLAGLPGNQRRTLVIETGIQNFGLYILISSVFFRSTEMLEVGVPYLFWMLLTSVAVIVLQRRAERRAPKSHRTPTHPMSPATAADERS
jgi:BASS family bile acid:Na+ symporter